MNFDIIAMTESRMKKNSVSSLNIELENYSIEHTPTEIAAGGALLYINKRLSYHPRNDWNICRPGKLEFFVVSHLPSFLDVFTSIQVNNFTNDLMLSLYNSIRKPQINFFFLAILT